MGKVNAMREISSRALINAILAIDSEIKRCEQFLESEELSEDDLENNGEFLLELQTSFGEFVGLYKERQSTTTGLPNLDNLLGKPL